MDSGLQDYITRSLSLDKLHLIPVGGGSINKTYRLEAGKFVFFCKVNRADQFPGMFQKERNGLAFLGSTGTILVPEVIWFGDDGINQVLILEWIEEGLRTSSFWKMFGEQLAALHRVGVNEIRGSSHEGRHGSSDGDRHGSSHGDRPTRYGFHEDNYMGALPQANNPCDEWVDFFITQRLQPQIQLACDKKMMTSNDVEGFGQLYKKLETIFPEEKPSALHGDLWSGNYLCAQASAPVLIDPAVYYGHRSIDLGMTKLFGGFDQVFYEAYHYHFPLPQNFDEQVAVCNLYPLLIHLNLFGSGYLSSIRTILKRYY
jgi:fructosamine-3-kinase